jgi:branched-chain amino acid transport system permease protein
MRCWPRRISACTCPSGSSCRSARGGRLAGAVLGAPTLRLRGDYLAIVTLGFGEIVRIFMNNLSAPVNITNGPKGINLIDPFRIGDFSFSANSRRLSGPIKYYYFLLLVLLAVIVINRRLQDSRIGRAWVAIREDEIAAKAAGINTRNIKLLAFAMGASFGGIAGGMFAAIQGFVSPESFILNESIMILAMVVLGGMGNIWGVIAGAVLLSFMPELLRYTVEPAQKALFGKMLVDPEVLRMLIFGLALVLTMRFRPAGLWPETRHRANSTPIENDRGPARSPQHRQEVRRRAGAEGCLADHPPRRDLRPDRPQRRRQDHAVQRVHRPLSARRRRGRLRRPAAATRQPAQRRRRRHRPHLPEHPPVRQHDGARERHGRPPRAHPGRRVRRDPAHPAPSARRKPPSAAVPTNCCITSASPTAPTTWRAICPTATSAGSKSPARWPPTRNCWRSTNRPPA